jgi:hypothetical protein
MQIKVHSAVPPVSAILIAAILCAAWQLKKVVSDRRTAFRICLRRKAMIEFAKWLI